MVAVSHLYLTAHGGWTSGPWAGEIAQIGLRLMPMATPGGSFTPMVTLERDIDVTPSFAQQDTTNTHAEVNWTGRSQGTPGATIGAQEQGQLAEAMYTFCSTIKGAQALQFRWTHVKLAGIYPLNGEGKYATPASSFTFKTPVAPTLTNTMPPQDAICVSLRTNVVGRRGRGRVFIPGATVNALTADGLVASATRTLLANAMVNLVDSLENSTFGNDGSYRVVICSAGSTTGVIPREVRVGDEWDSQRSRENARNETYTTITI